MSDTPDTVSEAEQTPPRDEQAVFNELADLCSAPGYIHALAYLYQSNNWITYKDAVTAEDMLPSVH